MASDAIPGSSPGSAWVEAARLADLAPGRGHEFVRDGRTYALVRVGDRVTALAGLCPHQKAHLAGGEVDAGREALTCPRRGCLRWRFDVRTGANAVAPAAPCPTFPVAVVAGRVFIALPA